MGRKIAKRKRYERRCQLLLQRVCRAFVHRIWAAQMAQARLEIDSATAIQRIVRGRIDRMLVEYVRYARWYEEKFIPAVIKTQSVVRAFRAKIFVKRMLLEIRSANICQNAWRTLQARREMLRRWKAARENIYTTLLQSYKKMSGDCLQESNIPPLNSLTGGGFCTLRESSFGPGKHISTPSACSSY